MSRGDSDEVCGAEAGSDLDGRAVSPADFDRLPRRAVGAVRAFFRCIDFTF